MTQLSPSVSGNAQSFRNGVPAALKCVLGVVFCLACLLMVMPGTSQAKGGGSRGGHSNANRSSGRTQRHQPIHHHPIQKHKHKHKQKQNDGDSDGGGDGGGDEGGDSNGGGSEGGAGAADGSGSAAAAEAVAPVVVGMEITVLYKGAASKGGLEIGDIIMSVNGTATPTFEALAQALAQAGSRAQLVVVREDGGERETITLAPQNGYIGVSVEPARVEE